MKPSFLPVILCFCYGWRIVHTDTSCFGLTCVSLKDCPELWKSVKDGVKPDTCGFDGVVPKVCCVHIDNRASEATSQREQLCKHYYGPANFEDALYGGVASLPQEFPHMAVLGFGEANDTVWGCGGSLISLNFVLTAAHCLNSRSFGKVKFVRLGDLDLKATDDDAQPQNHQVLNTFAHPKYRPPSKYNDIGLIELARPADITAYVRPACLQSTFSIRTPEWIATGWGDLTFAGERADHLQKATMREYTIDECRQVYEPHSRQLKNGIVEEMQICAGEEDKDTCQGDSGGPLQIRNVDYIDGYTIIGVTSFGKACGISKSPGVYTRVSSYIDWIESIVWGNKS